MKKNILFTLCALPLLVHAQSDTFQLKGKVGNFNTPVKAYLIYNVHHNRQVDSSILVNGTFSFSGKLEEPTFSQIILSFDGKAPQRNKRYDVLNLYLEHGEVAINSRDSVYKAVVSGSKINADYKNLEDKLRPVKKQEADLKLAYFSTPQETRQSPAFRQEIKSKDSLLNIDEKAILMSYIQANPSSQVSLSALQQYAGQKPDAAKVLALFECLSKSVKQSYSGLEYESFLSGMKRTAIGSLAPDFSVPDTAGTMVTLSSFRGKYLLVDFWASWCVPCRQENPNYVNVYQKYHLHGFDILSVSLDQPNGRSNWINAIHHDGLTWTQVSDLKYWTSTAAVIYGIKSIPQNFLIDPSGRIIGENLRGENLENVLSKLF